MRKMLFFLLSVLMLLAGHPLSGVGGPTNTVHVSKEQVARLETAIGRAIIWHRYWQENKTVSEIRKETSKSQSLSYTLCQSESEDVTAYVDELQWTIDLTLVGSNYYGFNIVDEKSLAQGDAQEAARSYSAALAHETAVLAKGKLTLNSDLLSVLAFEKPGEKQFSVVTNLVTTNLLNAKWLNREKTKQNLRGPLTVRIGGFNNESPWIYYRIEGMPYIGMMLYDPLTGEFIHNEAKYIDQIPGENEFRNTYEAIGKAEAKVLLNLN
jgi:hypothetical protein